MAERVAISTFRGLSTLPIQWALDHGFFARAGLDVALEWAHSSADQLVRLDGGDIVVAHTSADNVFGPNAPFDAIIVGEWSAGRLTVVRDPDPAAAERPWAVDSADSGFSVVLRAILEKRLGVQSPALVAVGSSPLRLDAVLAGSAAGTILHPGFERRASESGLTIVGDDGDLSNPIMTDGIMVRRDHRSSPAVGGYLEAWLSAARAVGSSAPAELAACVKAAGLDDVFPRDTIEHVRRDTGLAAYLPARLDALDALVRLRNRYLPGWVTGRPSLSDYLK